MNLKEKKGIILVITLGLILLFVIAAASFMLMGKNELGMVGMQSDSTRALYLAEAGFERAKYDLGQDSNWADGDINGFSYTEPDPGDPSFQLLNYDAATKTSLGGEFTVWLKSIVGSTNEIWVKSTASYNDIPRTVQARMESLATAGSGGANVDAPIEVEGSLSIQGSADIEPEEDIETGVVLNFENIFGISKEQMEGIATTYYPTTFNNDIATGITWVSAAGTESQITTQHADGDRDGIFIVDGDLKITGGTFNGVIWVIGSLTISGNPTINGGIFVESGTTVDTSVSGNATINFNASAVGTAWSYLTSSPPIIESWQEVSN